MPYPLREADITDSYFASAPVRVQSTWQVGVRTEQGVSIHSLRQVRLTDNNRCSERSRRPAMNSRPHH
jgi:hypothetical protein